MSTVKEVVFHPVGIVRTWASDDEIRERRHELEARIEIFPEFKEALGGLERFSHIFVSSFFHRLRPRQVRPRRLLRNRFKLEELPSVGSSLSILLPDRTQSV